ncbi:MAG: universal stress protein [Thermodesulfobacteriota bacterium]
MQEQGLACPVTRGKRILVAVDGSVYSDYAVDQAVILGAICNSKIYLISVVDLLPEQMRMAPDLVEKMSREAKELLDRAQEKVSQANLSSEIIVRSGGRAYDFIVQEAKERDVDLIVMGTHGRTGLRNILMGSVAQHVLGKAPCPVLVLPAQKQEA